MFHDKIKVLLEFCDSRFPKYVEKNFDLRFAGTVSGVGAGFGNQFIFGYEVEVELPIQLENGNEVEYE